MRRSARDPAGALAIRIGKAGAKVRARRDRPALYRGRCRDRFYRASCCYPGGARLESWLLGRTGRDPVIAFSAITAEGKQYRFRSSQDAREAIAAMEAGEFKARDFFGKLF